MSYLTELFGLSLDEVRDVLYRLAPLTLLFSPIHKTGTFKLSVCTESKCLQNQTSATMWRDLTLVPSELLIKWKDSFGSLVWMTLQYWYELSLKEFKNFPKSIQNISPQFLKDTLELKSSDLQKVLYATLRNERNFRFHIKGLSIEKKQPIVYIMNLPNEKEHVLDEAEESPWILFLFFYRVFNKINNELVFRLPSSVVDKKETKKTTPPPRPSVQFRPGLVLPPLKKRKR